MEGNYKDKEEVIRMKEMEICIYMEEKAMVGEVVGTCEHQEWVVKEKVEGEIYTYEEEEEKEMEVEVTY